jgi:hypothetical protein
MAVIEKGTVVEMTVDAFINVPDNPRQRDTERHARKAVKGHLSTLSPTHRYVAIATINGMPVCKEDGHTRALLWKTGRLERPKSVTAICYEVESIQQAASLYTHFDNVAAVEGCSDRMFGACRESSLVLTSPLLHKYDFATALKCAHAMRPGANAINEYGLVGLWRGVISHMDKWQLCKNRFKGSGIVAFGFVAIASKSFADDTLESFFKTYNEDGGTKDGKKRDGVQALSEHMEQRRFANQMTGYENIYDMMSKAYSCMKAWSDGVMIHNVQPSVEALVKLHAKARKNIDNELFTH